MGTFLGEIVWPQHPLRKSTNDKQMILSLSILDTGIHIPVFIVSLLFSIHSGRAIAIIIGKPITSILRDELRFTYCRLDIPIAAISPRNRKVVNGKVFILNCEDGSLRFKVKLCNMRRVMGVY